MASIHISLPEGLKDYVRRRVAQGSFSTPSDYLRALIRADQEREARREALLHDLDAGLAQLDRGEAVPGEEVFRRLEERFGRAD